MKFARFLPFIAPLLVASVASADVRWNLTTADFQTQPINLLAIDNAGVRFVDKGSIEQTIPLDQFVGLQESVASPRPASAKLMLVLNTGTRLTGEAKELKDEKLTFVSPNLGEMTFPLKQIVRLEAIAKSSAAKPAASKTEDILQLNNGDTVRGVIDGISATSVTIKTPAGPSEVTLDTVAVVVFAETGDIGKAATKGYKIEFDDGSMLAVETLTVQGSNVSIALPGGASCVLDLSKLTSIEQLDGPVAWLSGVTPSEITQVPFLDVSWPARMDRSVTGDTLRFGARTFTRGIGVHSHSTITWPLDGGYKSFRTQYAIDGNLPYADVDVRVLLDGKVVHEAKDFKSGILSPVVSLDLGTAKTITLEVDFGAGYDVQDRLNWIEPALLKFAVTPPTTQP